MVRLAGVCCLSSSHIISEVRISFIAFVFTNKECVFLKLVHNVEHETESNNIEILQKFYKFQKIYTYIKNKQLHFNYI